MKFDSRVDSERVVIASALLIGWAIWTVLRHLILPALIAGGGLLLVMTGWRPEPVPVSMNVLPPIQVESMPVMTVTPVRIPQQLDSFPSPDLPPAVRQQIRAHLDRLSRNA